MCLGVPRWGRRPNASISVSEHEIEDKTFNKGSLGSRIDEERSEARNVV